MVSITHAARDIGRLRDISTVLVRHGFGEFARRLGLLRAWRSKEPGSSDRAPDSAGSDDEARGAHERLDISLPVRVRLVLQDLGPSFVKLGQIASTRPDVLPADLVEELRKLQDAVPPVPLPEIRGEVELALGADLDQVYERFEPEPLAAASISQVHRARLRTPEGLREVVVKVQRPGAAETMASDLDILHALAALAERAIPESRIYSPAGLVQQFDRAITDELDFTLEAENAERFARNFEGDPEVRFPKVYRQASAKRVITLEWLDGAKIDAAIGAGHSGKRIAHIALRTFLKQVFEDGFFHADPHPGNVFVLGPPDGPQLALLDLGMVGRLSPRLRDLAADVMVAAVRRDYDAIADAMLAIATTTERIDMDAFRSEVALLADKYLGKQLKDIELSVLIRDLVQAATKYGLEIPSELSLVAKAMMTVEGIGKQIDPTLDVFEETKPFFIGLLRKRYSPERIGNKLLRRFEKLSEVTYDVPQQLHQVLHDLRLGRLSIRVEDIHLQHAADRLGRRIYSALVSASLVLGGTWLLTAQLRKEGFAVLALAALWLLVHATGDAYRAIRHKHRN
jgi:ubiquinone biosynthesis protein